MLGKKIIRGGYSYYSRLLMLSLAFTLFFSSCDVPMGIGDPVDLEPPIVRVTGVEVDGGLIPLETTGAVFFGREIMHFGLGAILVGEAWDNVGISGIRVRETETNMVWVSHDISARSLHSGGWQEWRITLDGLQPGERVIEITAFDLPENIGPQNVRQLTLIVDMEDPFVRDIEIERHPGVFTNLLPLASIDELSIHNINHVDFFQNESFTLRARINHEFSLSDVSVSLKDETNDIEVTPQAQREGTLFTPSWEFRASDFINASPIYESGRHIFRVLVTARAVAGHTGDNVTNTLFNLIWYPESDSPRILYDIGDHSIDTIIKSTDTLFPMHIFDDDNLANYAYQIIQRENWSNWGDINWGSGTNITTNTRRSIVTVAAPADAGLYYLALRVTDIGGVTSFRRFYLEALPMDFLPELIDITNINPNGFYGQDATLTFNMVFNTRVNVNGSAGGASITIAGGAGGNTGGPVTIPMANSLGAGGSFILTGTWTVPAGISFYPLVITHVNVQGVHSAADPSTFVSIEGIEAVRNSYNQSRDGLHVLSVAPTITHINGHFVNEGIEILPRTDGDNSVLSLTFNHAVFPESGGIITIRPAADWLVPPVIGNEDFTRIIGALTYSGDRNTLMNFYTATTHGLRIEPPPPPGVTPPSSSSFVPDISPKRVLEFNRNLDAPEVRIILDRARFNWHELDVHSSAVTINGNTVNITFTPSLPRGRIWKIEITPNAFRDAAGNTFAGWAAGTNHIFWSQQVETPVIRVNRVSNNRSTAAQASNPRAILQTDVQFRIDSETPGAVIHFATWNRGNTTTLETVGGQTGIDRGQGGGIASINLTQGNTPDSRDVYRPRSIPGGLQNSNILDATVAELTTGITALQLYSRPSGGFNRVGDNSFYTARKDYIVAEATHPNLTRSTRGKEGAFKTLIIFRDFYEVPNRNMNTSTSLFLRLEGSTTNAGPVTVEGFPMQNHDMTGARAFNFYRYEGNHSFNNANNNIDWIWISWEIVSEFWTHPMIANNPAPGIESPLTPSGWSNPWQDLQGDWPAHSWRTYGNWSLRVGAHRNLWD